MSTKKRLMGDAAEALFKPSTGAAALAAISSEVAPLPVSAPLPPPATPSKEVQPKEEPPTKFAVTTFRLKPDQWEALRLAALEQAKVKGGKADASEVLRGILDHWMASRKKV